LHNARKFTEAGGRVQVRLAVEGRRAALAVEDTGSGIEAAMFPHLFDAFAQADRSLDRSKGGLGLGLSLVKGLVQLHGGEVQAASAGAGKGAAFTVWLPVEHEETAVCPSRVAAGRPPARLARVLVVEDNRDAAASLQTLLELFGHEVAVAHSGIEGVDTACAWLPDVVLCDIGLPGLDGYAVIRALRRNPQTAAARMIALTGYGSDDDRRRTQEAGFDRHLVKPVEPGHLQEVLAVNRSDS
jgi:CheY-like chemotaxis protein